MARWTQKSALEYLGLNPFLDPREDANFVLIMKRWKDLTVEARRTENMAEAAKLSEVKNIIKAVHQREKNSICPDCGNRKSSKCARCNTCDKRHRFYPKTLKESQNMSDISNLNKVEKALSLIPDVPRKTSALMMALTELSKGQIGDSFVTHKPANSVLQQARYAGGIVTCRLINQGETERKKRRYRVWRTDGKSMEEVNEIISRRMAGEVIPKPPEWVRPSKEELKAMGFKVYEHKNEKPAE